MTLCSTIAVVPAWAPTAKLVVELGPLLHILLALLVTIHCLRHRRDPTSAVFWILLAWTFPGVGVLLFASFGINKVPVKGWHKQKADQAFLSERRTREDAAMPLAYWRAVHDSLAAEPEAPFARELNSAMNATLPDYPLLRGNHIEPLLTGDEAYPRMLESIRSAKHHVHLQTFIIGNDAVGREFMEALKERANAGVTVRFLFDKFGSTGARLTGLFAKYRNIPNLHMAGWTQANPIKRQFQINLRNHRKLLVVDGRVAYAGGINLRDENVTRAGQPPIRDYHFAIQGPIVQELQYLFLRDWYFMTDEKAEVLLRAEHFPHLEPAGTALARVVNGGPTAETEVLTDVFFSAIVAARKQLLAVTPYLVPTEDILRALRSAALRGVEVRLVVPRKNNHVYAGLAARALYEDLLTAGVRIFEREPPFMHAKALIVDDTLAIVGTANLDVRSLRLNYETNLAVYGNDFINALKRVVLEEITLSGEADLSTWRNRPVTQKVLENFSSLLTPVL